MVVFLLCFNWCQSKTITWIALKWVDLNEPIWLNNYKVMQNNCYVNNIWKYRRFISFWLCDKDISWLLFFILNNGHFLYLFLKCPLWRCFYLVESISEFLLVQDPLFREEWGRPKEYSGWPIQQTSWKIYIIIH